MRSGSVLSLFFRVVLVDSIVEGAGVPPGGTVEVLAGRFEVLGIIFGYTVSVIDLS